MPQVSLTVNGTAHTVEVEGRTLLVELLREKLNSARDKAENAPEDEELSHVAEFARALYEKARNRLLNHERACEDFLEHDFR